MPNPYDTYTDKPLKDLTIGDLFYLGAMIGLLASGSTMRDDEIATEADHQAGAMIKRRMKL